MEGLPAKRRRLSNDEDAAEVQESSRTPKSLSRAISPPKKKRAAVTAAARERVLIPSPFRLTTIRDLPRDANVDAVSLRDLLGDPLIAECWEFNYLHDVDFLMSHLDEDTRSLTKVHIVHGFWKREDPNRIFLEQQASQYKNVVLHTAYMPEMFGTHHSKMLILLRHDDTAQVIIHTANMIAKDWTNLTNGVWQSPLLPLLPKTTAPPPDDDALAMGSGPRFKSDLLSYLRAYNARRDVCRPLVAQLQKHDFACVRGALVASVPGKHDVHDEPAATRWGWAGAKHALRSVPCGSDPQAGQQRVPAEIVAQISSIATLGPTDTWLRRTLFGALSASAPPPPKKTEASSSDSDSTKTTAAAATAAAAPAPEFRVIFPTPDEIRRSLDGYASGASIHTKIQSAQQKKQLEYLRPMLCHWANDSEKGTLQEAGPSMLTGDGGRNRAAPHIKTYIRYGGEGGRSIDWALLTSANISKQAWGEAASSASGGQFRIASWEIGVLVWPGLFDDGGGGRAHMVGTFQKDMPTKIENVGGDAGGGEATQDDGPLVGLRIPYSLPLRRYADDEVPWVATADYREPDWKGQTW